MAQKVEYGTDNKGDLNLYRKVSRVTEFDLPGGVTNKRIVTVIGARNRIINTDIPEGEEGRIKYTDWKVIDKNVKEEQAQY